SIELAPRRELAVDEEIGHLEERAPGGQLLDGVAAVAQDPLLAVDEGDRAPAGARIAIARIQRDQPGGRAELLDVDRGLVLCALDDRKRERGSVVGQVGGLGGSL